MKKFEEFTRAKQEKHLKNPSKRKRLSVTFSKCNKIADSAGIKDFFVRRPLPQSEQELVAQRLIDYIVTDAKPVSTVDSASFRRFVATLNPLY